MALGDRLGLAGVLLALITIAVTYLWPDKKWIGWISLCAAIILVCAWAWMEFGRTFAGFDKDHQTLGSYALVAVVGALLFCGVWYAIGRKSVSATVIAPQPSSGPTPDSEVAPQQVKQLTHDNKMAIVGKIVQRYQKKHNGKLPSVPQINQRLEEQGQTFSLPEESKTDRELERMYGPTVTMDDSSITDNDTGVKISNPNFRMELRNGSTMQRNKTAIDDESGQHNKTTKPASHATISHVTASQGPQAFQQLQPEPAPSPGVPHQTISQTPSQGIVGINKNLSNGDRERLANALFEFSQVLDQAHALWENANDEGGDLSQAWQSGSITKDFEAHRTKLRGIQSSAKTYEQHFMQVRQNWRYYSDQTNYIFGDDPDNNALIIRNAVDRYSNYLDRWVTIQNKDQRPVLELFEGEQNQFTDAMTKFAKWKQGCERRLDEMKKSIQ